MPIKLNSLKAQLSVKSGVDFLFKDITTITEEIDNVLRVETLPTMVRS